MTSHFPDNAFYVFGTRSAVDDLNRQKLAMLPGDQEVIKAIHIHPYKNAFKPCISGKDGTVNETPFLDELLLKKNARVMLTYNVDTSDGLTNGTTGTVSGFIRNTRGQTTHILIVFDELHFGEQMRAKLRYLIQAKGDPRVTPIPKVSFEYSLGKIKREHAAKAKVIQFPLVLAWAITAHKFQGQTVKMPASLVADLASVFDGGQAYVMLGRVQNLGQLYLKSFVEKNIRANKKALEEAEKLSNLAKCQCTEAETLWKDESRPGFLKIIVLNIRSLQKHFADLMVDSVIQNSDVICLTETWLLPDTNPQVYQIPGFSCKTASKGRGAGVAIYVKNIHAKSSQVPVSIMTNELQAVRVSLSSVDILAVYRSPTSEIKISVDVITNGIKESRSTFICGDFNAHIGFNHSNPITSTLSSRGFQQIVKQPTHLQGNLLDHVYVNFQQGHWYRQFLHSPYYSDHDAICTIIQFPWRIL